VNSIRDENRHFLAEVPALPFEVMTSDEVVRRLDLPGG
jgi:hypothetical protein